LVAGSIPAEGARLFGLSPRYSLDFPKFFPGI